MKPSQALRTWITLNDEVRSADEDRCLDLMAAELSGCRRQRFVMRIHSRLNRVRAERERRELKKKSE